MIFKVNLARFCVVYFLKICFNVYFLFIALKVFIFGIFTYVFERVLYKLHLRTYFTDINFWIPLLECTRKYVTLLFFFVFSIQELILKQSNHCCYFHIIFFECLTLYITHELCIVFFYIHKLKNCFLYLFLSSFTSCTITLKNVKFYTPVYD